MKKIAILSFLISLASFSSFAQDGIKFQHDSWEAVVAKAKAENKLIFLDAYTSWCGPCKMLQKNVFPDQALGSYFNQNFLSTKIDMEKGEGPTIARKFRVRAYPTLFFIDPNTEQVVHKILGYKNADQLKAMGATALSKLEANRTR